MAETEAWRVHLPLAHRLADASGAVILRYFRQSLAIEDKEHIAGYSPVTAADREAEAVIRALINESCPDHGILGEEHGHERPDARFTWVIDPIDGTKAFISGMTTWGTLIALQDRGRGIIGVLDQPFLRERFIGHGEGAYLGDRQLAVRSCPDLSGATLYATEPNMFTPAELAAFDALAARVRLRRFGADCYAYGMLAAGFIDLVVGGEHEPLGYRRADSHRRGRRRRRDLVEWRPGRRRRPGTGGGRPPPARARTRDSYKVDRA